MKIEKLIINNFRIFNGRYELDFLNKDLVVISGPNGNGKSTIFDSIQWCLTGKIPRYEGSDERRKFNYLMNERVYKQSGTPTMSVEVWLRTETDVQHKICRSQKKNRTGRMDTPELTIDGESFNITNGGHKIRDILASTELNETTDNNQDTTINLSAFFASTQLLSQDALNDFIADDKPGQRYELIDKVLGIRKYGEDFERFIGLAKETAKEQLENLKEQLEGPTDELKRVSIQLSEKEKLLESIGEVSEMELLDRTRDLIKHIGNCGIKIPDSLVQINQLNEYVSETIVSIRKTVLKENDYLEQVITDLQGSRELMSLTHEEYQSRKHVLNQQFQSLVTKLEKRAQGVMLVKQRKVFLESLKVRRKSFLKELQQYNDLLLEKNTLEAKKKAIFSHEALIEAQSQFSELNTFFKTFEQRQQEQTELNTCLKFHELDKIVKGLEKQIISELNVYQEKSKVLEIKERELTLVNQKILDTNNTANEQKESTIDQLIRQIQQNLLQKEEEETCPVCGSEFKPPQSLRESIYEQIEKVNRLLSELDQQLLELTAKKGTLEVYNRGLRSDMEQLKEKFLQKQAQVEGLTVEREIARATMPLLLSNLTINDLHSRKSDIDKFLNHYKIAYDLLASLNQINIDLEKLSCELEQQLEKLEMLKLNSKRWDIYLELEETKIDKMIRAISKYFIKVEEANILLQLEKEEVSQQERALDNRWIQRKQKIEEFQKKLTTFKGDISEIDYWVRKFTELMTSYGGLDSKLATHLTKLRSFLSRDEVFRLKAKIVTLQEYVGKQTALIGSYNAFVDSELEYLIKKHTLVRSELIGDYLLQHSDYIDQLFMQISPHAVYRHVQLVPKEKNLYVVMTKQSAKERDLRKLSEDELKQQFNASLSFSSGQSNVLAVCIFLALNRSQKWTKLKLLGIDDPFQNLDDINVFSFIDVLSQVVAMQNKQVLISTHSEDFVHLMKVKMGIDPEKVGTIVFQGYSEQGVSIEGNCVVIGEST